MPISSDLSEAWEAYQVAEKRGLRRDALAKLERFLDLLESESNKISAEFVRHWCREVLDAPSPARLGNSAVARLPFLERAILPALLAARSAGDGDACRWLAQIARHIPALRNNPDHHDPRSYLSEALERNLADERARRLLFADLYRELDYLLHELPQLLGTVEEIHDLLYRMLAVGKGRVVESQCAKFEAAIIRILEGDRSPAAIAAYHGNYLEWRAQ